MKKAAFLFLFIFVALLKVNAQNDGFIENKGQFPSQVIAAVSLSNGYLFVEKDGLVFSLFDQNKSEEEHYSKKVQGGLPRFAFKQCFEKINPSAIVGTILIVNRPLQKLEKETIVRWLFNDTKVWEK